jgi:hypothetical protein
MNAATYSLLMMRPDTERLDVLCVGLAARDAEGAWHIATLPRPEKLLAVAPSGADRLPRLEANLRDYLADCDSFEAARQLLSRTRGALELHEFEGAFAYTDLADFEAQVNAIMRESVLPPEAAAAPRARVHRVRPHTRARLRRQFESMGILARHADEISDHKVVRNFPVSLEHGLTAEFALRNSVMHITETVDFDVADTSVRGKTFEAQAKCLIMRAARDAFGSDTQCYVIVSGGGAAHAARSVDLLSTAGRLFSADDKADMTEYLDRMSRAAGGAGQLLA